MALVRVLLILAVGFALASCLSTQVAPEKRAAIKRVAIVSLIQDALSARDTSGLIESYQSIPDYKLPEWKIQQRVERTAAKWLSEQGFEVVHVRYPAEEIWSTYLEPYHDFWASRQNAVRNLVLPYVKDKIVDATIVVYPGEESKLCPSGPLCDGFGSNGFGLLVRSAMFFGDEPYVYASVNTMVIDTPSGDVLAFASYSDLLLLRAEFEVKSRFDDYSAEDREAVRERVDGLISIAVDTALSDAGLRSQGLGV
jgi:hypothetical protein